MAGTPSCATGPGWSNRPSTSSKTSGSRPPDRLPPGLPEGLIELYAGCDGARLFLEAIELSPAVEIAVTSPPQSFTYDGRRISYREYGAGPRPIVLVHGLLMDGRMYAKLAPTLVAHGHHVITVDVLGHGASDQPHDMTCDSMPQFGRDVIALLDHLGLDQAVVGGTSLGANVALEVAVAAPERVRALFIEMPVLEHGLAAAAATFVPL